MRLVRIWTLLVALCLVVSTGCKEDPMVRARAAHATEKPDEAEKALQQVLAQKPKDFEARRLMADVHRFRGDYQKTEEALNELWKEKGFDDEEKEFPPEERAQRDLLENQYNELYKAWSESLDPATDAEKFEKVVRAGLEWNPKNPTLNRLLVDHFLAKAKELEEAGKRAAAAAEYEEVLQLRVLQSQRKEVQEKVEALRKEAFAEDVKKHFESIKAELQEAEQWDEAKKAISFDVEAEVNRRLRQARDADLQKARKEAAVTIRTSIAEWIAKVTGLDPQVAAATTLGQMGSGDEKLNRGKYSVKITMLLDDVIDSAFKANQKLQAARQKAAKDAEQKGEEANEQPSEEAGQTNGGEADGQTNGKE